MQAQEGMNKLKSAMDWFDPTKASLKAVALAGAFLLIVHRRGTRGGGVGCNILYREHVCNYGLVFQLCYT